MFDKGINAKKYNKALCKGFVKLQTPDEAEESTSVSIEDQVVTKVPVTKLTKITKHAKRHFWLNDVCTCHGLLPSHSA